MGHLLCLLGLHHWAGPYNTLPDYCLRCGRIDLEQLVQPWEEHPDE